MADCKKCSYFDINAFVCKNKNVSEQHRIGSASCSYFSGQTCSTCRYAEYGNTLFTRSTLWCVRAKNTSFFADTTYPKTSPSSSCAHWTKKG